MQTSLTTAVLRFARSKLNSMISLLFYLEVDDTPPLDLILKYYCKRSWESVDANLQRPLIRRPDKGIIFTRINPQDRDTSL